jgi:hypothetical protein
MPCDFMSDDRRQMTDDRRQMTDDRMQRSENRYQNTEGRPRTWRFSDKKSLCIFRLHPVRRTPDAECPLPLNLHLKPYALHPSHNKFPVTRNSKSALCPMLYSLCSMLSALFSLLYTLCSLLSALSIRNRRAPHPINPRSEYPELYPDAADHVQRC